MLSKEEETIKVVNNLKELIESGENQNVALALEMMEGVGVHPALYTHLVFLSEVFENYEIQKKAKNLAEKAFPRDFQEIVKSFDFHVFYDGMDEDDVFDIDNFPTNALLNKDAFCKMLLIYFKVGGKYCFENQVLEPKEILKHCIVENELSIYDFRLKQFPEEICSFTQISYLDIQENDFTTVPDAVRNLTNLQNIHYDVDKIDASTVRKLENTFPHIFVSKLYDESYSHLEYDKDLEKAYKKALRALELDPNHVNSLIMKGLVEERNGQVDTSMQTLHKALQLEPTNTLIYSNLALVYHVAKDDETSLKVAEDGLAVIKNHKMHGNHWEATLWFRKGQALFHLDRLEESYKPYQESLKIDNSYGASFYNVACIFARWEDKKNTLSHLKKAIRCDKKYKKEAKKDTDFQLYWQDEAFIKLVNS